MPSPFELISAIRGDAELHRFLAESPEFNVDRRNRSEGARLSSGAALEEVAGDFTGGSFFLCGEAGAAARPVLYASSEGAAGVLGSDLSAALELMIGLPYWRDCLGFSAGGDLAVMRTAARLLQEDLLARDPGVEAAQDRAAAALGVARPPVPELVARLQAAVADAGPDFGYADETGSYGGLFGPFEPSRNPRWRDRLG